MEIQGGYYHSDSYENGAGADVDGKDPELSLDLKTIAKTSLLQTMTGQDQV